MSILCSRNTTTRGGQNGSGSPTVSVWALLAQIHTSAQRAGLFSSRARPSRKAIGGWADSRRIVRQLGVNPKRAINWVNAHIAALPEQSPQPERVLTIESHLFTLYRCLVHRPGFYTPMPDKSETYYLARLARRSRCFLRCIHALRHAVKLFVFAWDRRQLYHHRSLTYPAHLINSFTASPLSTPGQPTW